MIKALAQTQKWQDALHSLDWPFDSNDVAKKTTVLSACGRTSQWSLLCLLADPKKQSQDKLVLSNVAISSFDRNSLWQQSCDVFASFALAALKPDKISFQSTLSSYSRGRQWTLALDLHDTYHSRFTGANSHGRVSVQSMQSASSYNMVTKACAQGAEWRNAVAILQEFLQSRLSLACEQRKRHEKDREQSSTAKHRELGQRTTADQERTASVFITSATSGCEKAAWRLVLNSVLSSSRADASDVNLIYKDCTMACVTADLRWNDSFRAFPRCICTHCSHRVSRSLTRSVCGNKPCNIWHFPLHLN